MRGVDLAAATVALLAEAERQGVVLTVEQRPLRPLAMGHFETVFELRPARAKA